MENFALIAACRRQSPLAQRTLYERYAPVMLGICRRYLRRREDAEDVLLEGFFRIFSKIGQYTGEGNFEGWMKRIMVNQCLMFLRKNDALRGALEIQHYDRPKPARVEGQLTEHRILQLLDQLPEGYRTIFNLYVIEGYKHREIAEELGISINTSKSQLIAARKRMAELVTGEFGEDVRHYNE